MRSRSVNRSRRVNGPWRAQARLYRQMLRVKDNIIFLNDKRIDELKEERDDYRALLVLLTKVDNQWEFYEDVVCDAIKVLEKYDA